MILVTLEITSGPHAGKNINLEAGQSVRVGRTEKADLATHDSYMSGLHFAVECIGEECRIRDLNSRNGTLLNKKKISEATLHDGDKIYAGQTNFVVQLKTSAPAAASSPSAPLLDTLPPAASAPLVEPAKVPANDNPFKPAAPPASSSSPLVVPPPVFKPPAPSTELARNKSAKLVQPPAQEPIAAPKLDQWQGDFAAASPEQSLHHALEFAAASTPEGRLLNILRGQTEPLFALLDAAREPKVPQLLRVSGEAYQSLYQGEAYAEVAPYLVQLPASSRFVETMVREGWGQGWSVYLTCSLPLQSLREYFRQNLMIKTPDGREFFSRFYDPRFFRVFLPGCTLAEAARFFGPISRYFMEAENPDILLQFINTKRGVEMKERLLLIAGT